MRAHTCVLVVGCVARKLRLCPSYSGRRDRNNSAHWRSLYKGGGLHDLGALTVHNRRTQDMASIRRNSVKMIFCLKAPFCFDTMG